MKPMLFLLAVCLIITFQSQSVLAAAAGTCGDGIRQATEQCDEGAANGAAGSGCSFACTINPGCYCNAPTGQVSTCTCSNNNSNDLWLLLIPLALLCCLLPLALLALGGNNGGGYGGGYGGYGGYGGGWRGLSRRLFGKAAPAPEVAPTPPRDAFVPAVIVPNNTAPELPLRESDSRYTQVVLSFV